MSHKQGLILVNLGTPESPTPAGVKAFLRPFLSDRRVVDLTPWLWRPLLELLILPRRSPRVARNYAPIWTPDGSPLLAIGRRQQAGVKARLLQANLDWPVCLAMTYGEPSLAAAWQQLKAQGVEEVCLLPLYPQYSSTTMAPVLDAWGRVMGAEKNVPALHLVRDYHLAPGYIAALANRVRHHWHQQGQGDCLLISFHGIPVRYATEGDPYPAQCQATAHALAQELGLTEGQWRLSFQSRFGKEPWLEPYTDETLVQLPGMGVRRLDVICPGFAADCLETLEEIAEEGKAAFLAAGGESYRYIPALNDQPDHLDLLVTLAAQALGSGKPFAS
ncbi:ferrochelatase [Pseudaeromonas sp. ZJS20]|uniref:ferrochelatase n=1 Tax=Pseudaeromonas aegiceratis TaxID=3153928 RepID=UPI00390C5852